MEGEREVDRVRQAPSRADLRSTRVLPTSLPSAIVPVSRAEAWPGSQVAQIADLERRLPAHQIEAPGLVAHPHHAGERGEILGQHALIEKGRGALS